MDLNRFRAHAYDRWDSSILPALERYIRIPNESPGFDAKWAEHGHMDRAVALARDWVEAAGVPGLRQEIVQLEGRTPVLFIEIPGTIDDTVLLYGHLDKQPPMHGWRDGLDPWTPVIENGRLYGRGSADDGYAVFASVTAVQALVNDEVPRARAVILIECCEESGSYDLPAYIEHLEARIGTPSLVVCLDSGCGDYERLWMTTSLRGMIGGNLKVEVLEQGVHSGDASGIVPSSFRILRQLLSRLENEATGEVQLRALWTDIPQERIDQAQSTAKVLGPRVTEYPFAGTTRAVGTDVADLLLARTWRPQLAVTGADGLPPVERAGSVLRPSTTLRLSMRLPPGVDPKAAEAAMKELLESDPPYGARVRFEHEASASGWNAPPLAPWLDEAIQEASQAYFGADACAMGEGGTIPFMAMLGERFPTAQFLITGVLGPHSNAHGPNEFLDIATGKRLTASVALVLARHGARTVRS